MAFISPNLWIRHSELLSSILEDNENVIDIRIRNENLIYGICQSYRLNSKIKATSRQIKMRDIKLLDNINVNSNIRQLTKSYFQFEINVNLFEKITTLFDWSVSNFRFGFHRTYAVATLLRYFISFQTKLKVTTKESIKREIQRIVYIWLADYSSLNDRNLSQIPKLIGELVRKRLFSYSSYLQNIISSGLKDSKKFNLIHSRILKYTPLYDSSLSIINLRRMSLDNKTNEVYEKQFDGMIRSFRSLLPRLYKRSNDIPAITAVDLENSFNCFKDLPCFYTNRAIQISLLPSVLQFVDLKTKESLLTVEELATIISIIEYFQDIVSLNKLVVNLINTLTDRKLLFLLMDSVRRHWTSFICLNAMENLIKLVIDKYNTFQTSGGQVRPLLLLLVTAKENNQFPKSLYGFLQNAVSTLEKSLKSTISSSAPPSTISEVQKLLYDSNISTATDLATTIWYKYSSFNQWGISAWNGVMDGIKVYANNFESTQNASFEPLVLSLSVFLHEVNHRFPDGLEKYIIGSIVNNHEVLLGDKIGKFMISILHQLIIRRVIQTISIIEKVYIPLIKLKKDEKVIINLNELLMASLIPEQKPSLLLSDHQHLLTRRGRAYNIQNILLVASILPLLIDIEMNENINQDVKDSCKSLRMGLVTQKEFSNCCMNQIENVYDSMLTSTNDNKIQLIIIDCLKFLTNFESSNIEEDLIFSSTIQQANPWTFCRHKVVLRLVLNYGGDDNKCNEIVTSLLDSLDNSNNDLIIDMLRGINGRAGKVVSNLDLF